MTKVHQAPTTQLAFLRPLSSAFVCFAPSGAPKYEIASYWATCARVRRRPCTTHAYQTAMTLMQGWLPLCLRCLFSTTGGDGESSRQCRWTARRTTSRSAR